MLCNSVRDVFTVASLVRIQFLDLVAVQVVQNQLKCEEDDTKDNCPDKEFGFPTKSVWVFHNYRN